jgi:hypothetical protein
MISSDHHRIWQLWSSVVTLKREILEELGMQNCSVSSKHRSMHWVCTNEYYLHSISRKAIAYSKNGWITLWKYEQGIRGQGAETLNRPTWVGGGSMKKGEVLMALLQEEGTIGGGTGWVEGPPVEERKASYSFSPSVLSESASVCCHSYLHLHFLHGFFPI